VEERLRRVEKETEDLAGRLTKSFSSIPEEIEKAITTEIGRFESLSNAIEVKDIYWTLAGVALGAVGIAIRIFA
ncbi:hypothetical protein, partial [Mycobacterium sp.]|uniref:hypothetical protein n=1 Tax=Mycobacterium sp. TaxID=1785 RepID=UPI003C756DA6